MVAELCLHVATILTDQNGSDKDARVLVSKGLRLARKAEKKMKNAEGRIILPIAYEIHEPVMVGLESLADELHMIMDESDRLDSGLSNSNGNSSAPVLTNLPESYMKKDHSDSSATGKSTGSGSWRNNLVTAHSDEGSGSVARIRIRSSLASSLVDSVAEEDEEWDDHDPTIRHGNGSRAKALAAEVTAGSVGNELP